MDRPTVMHHAAFPPVEQCRTHKTEWVDGTVDRRLAMGCLFGSSQVHASTVLHPIFLHCQLSIANCPFSFVGLGAIWCSLLQERDARSRAFRSPLSTAFRRPVQCQYQSQWSPIRSGSYERLFGLACSATSVAQHWTRHAAILLQGHEALH